MYETLDLYIDGAFGPAVNGKAPDVVNPATAKVLARVPLAATTDLDAAVAAADRGFKVVVLEARRVGWGARTFLRWARCW